MKPPTEEQITFLTHIFTSGYQRGHEDTVEAQFTDVARSEYGTFFRQDVEELTTDLAPALLEAAREFNKLQELRKKWGGDDYGSLTTSQHFDCYCEDQAEELSEVKEENLRLRKVAKGVLDLIDPAVHCENDLYGDSKEENAKYRSLREDALEALSDLLNQKESA